MADTIEQRLEKMGVVIPDAPAPVAAYVGYVTHGDLVYVSGQLPFIDGKVSLTGHLGDGVTVEQAAEAARVCAINLLAHVKVACGGDLERVVQCIRLCGYVASKPDFTDQPPVINGASNFIGEVLGERGAHSRAAVGVAALPLNASVEVDGIFAIR